MSFWLVWHFFAFPLPLASLCKAPQKEKARLSDLVLCLGTVVIWWDVQSPDHCCGMQGHILFQRTRCLGNFLLGLDHKVEFVQQKVVSLVERSHCRCWMRSGPVYKFASRKRKKKTEEALRHWGNMRVQSHEQIWGVNITDCITFQKCWTPEAKMRIFSCDFVISPMRQSSNDWLDSKKSETVLWAKC